MKQEMETYLTSLVTERTALFTEMELYASQHEVPIMDLIGMEALLQLLRLHKPKKILEVGSAIGYSALRMADALPETTIVTLERDEERIEKAQQYFKRSKHGDRIVLLTGDALELQDRVAEHGQFDAIFIDAAKGQYRKFFELYSPLLSEHGLIITDNVLYKGLVAMDEKEIDQRRIRSLVRKIRDFNVWLTDHPDYHTTILPIGDGVAISLKK
ncbi:O-methyltransferase [Peribacillus alkalitolerans]|uniref:O-methyltransferase n=1 Tax=Peribacillus alkalitolerans TaxID=1550385 RepID=UPI0013D13247|nr:O-methyltransferase [Peribacillus alkalitolerans]